MESLSRRKFLAGLGLAAAGAAVGGATSLGVKEAAGASDGDDAIDFYGRHQAGITTPQQDRLCFAAFDLTTDSREDVVEMLQKWTEASALMCAGQPAGEVEGDLNAPPDDTGEAYDLHAARLTITVGFGPTFFEKDGIDRYGVNSQRPPSFRDLPPFFGDRLDPERSGGDICVQACADDPQVAFHAVRNFARIGRGTVVMRWSQLGFGRTASTSRSQGTPRNLMGLKDGTNNIKAEDTELLRDHVWANSSDGAAWMDGGTYLVARRIRMLIETWDRASLVDQEVTIGRHKISGAPLGRKKEHDPVDLDEVDERGDPVIPMDSHVRLAMPETNNGARMLRRGYSYTDGMDHLGQLDAGLFFIAFVRDIGKQFVPVQHQLARNDALNEYIKHVGSGVYAIPPGVRKGGFFGDGLLG